MNTRSGFDFTGKAAVVTGAASGIGFAVAGALAAEGTSVVLADVDDDALRARAKHLSSLGHVVHHVTTDVGDPDAVEELAAAAVDRFGGLHIAVNNAGIVNRGLSWELSLEDWHRVLDVDLWGVIHGVRSFVPRILSSGDDGHVVNTASMASLLPVDRLGPYTVAKHAVLGLSDVLRLDLERSGAPIGVSVVMPGRVQTGMNPYGTTTADTVARNIMDAIGRNRPYVYSDRDGQAEVEDRFARILSARDDVIDRQE